MCVYPSIKDYKNLEDYGMIHTRLLKWVNEAGVFRKGGRGKFKQKGKGKIDLIKKGGGESIYDQIYGVRDG